MTPRIIVAQANVVAARGALIETARELQLRLQPKTLAREAWESAKEKGADLAEDAVDAVKRRPVATGGIVAAIAMFLARGPITDAVSKIYGGMTSDEEDETLPPAQQTRTAGATPAPPRKTSAARRETEIKI
jgi:hypothetical protein